MEDNNRRRRPAEPLPLNTNQRYHQTVQNPQQQQQPQQQAHRTMAGTNSDRYRPAPLNTSPPSAGRAGLGAASTSYYYQDPATATGFSAATAGISNTAMGFQQQSAPGYGTDTRQAQSFSSGYGNTNIMYNVPQASAQSTGGVYDTSSQAFDIRQTAVPIPDVTNAAYYPNEPTNAAAASAMQQQQPSTAQSAAVYQQGSADNRSNLLSYSSNVPGSLGAMATQATSSAPDVNMEESGEYQSNDLNQAYSQYQEALKEVGVNINRGYLAPAGESLRSVSDWLLANVNELGTCDSLKHPPRPMYHRRRPIRLTLPSSHTQDSPRTTRLSTATGSSYGTTSTMLGWVCSKCKGTCSNQVRSCSGARV